MINSTITELITKKPQKRTDVLEQAERERHRANDANFKALMDQQAEGRKDRNNQEAIAAAARTKKTSPKAPQRSSHSRSGENWFRAATAFLSCAFSAGIAQNQFGLGLDTAFGIGIGAAVVCGVYYRQAAAVAFLAGVAYLAYHANQQTARSTPDTKPPIAQQSPSLEPLRPPASEVSSSGASPRLPTQIDPALVSSELARIDPPQAEPSKSGPSTYDKSLRTALEQAPPPERDIAILTNSNAFAVHYGYRRGDGDWQQAALAAHEKRPLERGASQRLPRLEICYDEALTDDTVWQTRSLLASYSQKLSQQDNPRHYTFRQTDDKLVLTSDQWEPDWPHPTKQGLVAAEQQGYWLPEEGYRFYSPGGRPTTVAVPTGVGMLGMQIKQDERSGRVYVASLYPGGVAERAGVQPGFEIVGTCQAVFLGQALKECQQWLRGPLGTEVQGAFSDQRGDFLGCRALLRK